MDNNQSDISMSPDELYLEEVFTDNKVGTIRRMTPVTSDGSKDDSREIVYIGSTQMMTPGVPMPLNFELSGKNLGEAALGFGDAANQAVEDTMKELQEMRRQQASQIVMPGQGGGSQIQMP
jgi:hypothetical protein